MVNGLTIWWSFVQPLSTPWRNSLVVKPVFSHYDQSGQLAGGFKYCPHCSSVMASTEIGDRLRPSCPSCGFVQHRNPAPSITILVEDNGRVLLGKRRGNPGKGTWALPSGYIDYEEDFLTAAIRETKEETGLEVEVLSIINVISSFVSPLDHFLGVYVSARVGGGELAAGDDLDEVCWFPLMGPYPELGFPEDSSILKMYAEGKVGLPVDPDYAVPGENNGEAP
jgi:8-oxo-dGTP diphosphatase